MLYATLIYIFNYMCDLLYDMPFYKYNLSILSKRRFDWFPDLCYFLVCHLGMYVVSLECVPKSGIAELMRMYKIILQIVLLIVLVYIFSSYMWDPFFFFLAFTTYSLILILIFVYVCLMFLSPEAGIPTLHYFARRIHNIVWYTWKIAF